MAGMPAVPTIFDWLEDHEEFSKQYARARRVQAEVCADEIIELADTPNIGVRIKDGPKGREVVRGDNVERSKLRVDARKWNAAKLLPKKYGNEPQDAEQLQKGNDELARVIRMGPIKNPNVS
jgi:hypothetical protein